MTIDLSPGGVTPVTEKNMGTAIRMVIELRDGLSTAGSWLERWGQHVGHCAGGAQCTCGYTHALSRARGAMAEAFPEDPPTF